MYNAAATKMQASARGRASRKRVERIKRTQGGLIITVVGDPGCGKTSLINGVKDPKAAAKVGLIERKFSSAVNESF